MPNGTTPLPPNDGTMTPMMATDGTWADVPNKQVEFGKTQGLTVGQYMRGPDGSRARVPLNSIQDAVKAGAMPEAPTMPAKQMQTSALPKWIRSSSEALPAVGMLGGGLAGAATGAPTVAGIPVGTVGGAALGGAAGENIRQNILNRIFSYKDPTTGKQIQAAPQPLSKQGLESTALQGTIGATSELGGALVSAYGGMVLKRLANAQSAGQVGDALMALKQYMPGVALSQKGIATALDDVNAGYSAQLNKVLTGAQGQVDLDAALSPVRARAVLEDSKFARTGATSKVFTPGTVGNRISNKISDIITAAKNDAGITGNMATAQQLRNFQNAVDKAAFSASQKYPGIGLTVQDVAHDAYGVAGQQLRQIAPQVDSILGKMTDVWAAKSALKNYSVSRAQALAMSVVTHPIQTAAVSPLLTAAGIVKGPDVFDRISKVAERYMPR